MGIFCVSFLLLCLTVYFSVFVLIIFTCFLFSVAKYPIRVRIFRTFYNKNGLMSNKFGVNYNKSGGFANILGSGPITRMV